MGRTRMAVAATAAALVAATSAVAAVPATAATTTTKATACPTGWGSQAETRSAATMKSVTNVRTGRHACFDRMVVDVPGVGTGRLGYTVQYVSRVHQDGSGRPVTVGGGAVIEVRVNAPAYDADSGRPTYPARAGQRLPGVNLTGYRTFRDARFVGSFEGDTQIGLGVRARLPFRVWVTDGRIVVDVAHNWTGAR
ncbi:MULTISPECIES: AMIN-like domain-containing (lipo)protein [unclassified Streptomyces]|uniref:AMIN-like domain-containing (lipo)protein n=1 Tax=unclassified Streptomyces TaxID=2593676 RepID=UPI0024B67867|nr:hypothetical protein [Streptomyces sp. KAU_LT]MDI9829760.1 hypothetical protein [Streptomyces sp. KAU_LT]